MEGEGTGAQRPTGGPVQAPCLECGSRDVEVTRPGWVEGVRDWLRSGGPWRPARRVCRRCGDVSGTAASSYLARRQGWGKRADPAGRDPAPAAGHDPGPDHLPRGGGGGGGAGAGAQLALGWPWWLVAAAVVAAVWLFFLSTAFWGRGRWSRSLATEVLMVVDPARAIQRIQREQAEAVRSPPFPLYGLPPSWPGPRHLGGWRRSGRAKGPPVTTALGLGHGDPRAERGPLLRVEVRSERGPLGPVPTASAEGRRGLAEDLWFEAAGPTSGGEDWDPIADVRGRTDPTWSRAAIPVDGRTVAFEWLAEGRHWVAWAQLGELTLVLHGRDLPVDAVALVRVTDLGPYVEGTRRLAAQDHGDRW
jgi:hypothetical protein